MNIGVSMRVVQASGYLEERDAIAHDWIDFLSDELNIDDWTLVPNVGEGVSSYLAKKEIDGFIITGGESLGVSKIRDVTEINIIQYALAKKLPVLGICRGMQMLYSYFGGKIIEGNESFKHTHTAQSHIINYEGEEVLVNSYHGNMLDEATCPREFNIIATCKNDNSIEAIKSENMLGLMWHPERKLNFSSWNIDIINDFFKTNK